MAQWNPYYGGSGQASSLYEDQNLESQVYNQSLPYGAVPYQQLGYNNYLVPNVSTYGSNLPANIRTAQEIEAEQFGHYLTQPVLLNQYSLPEKNSNSIDISKSINSTLTPTAAEFKPSTSGYQNAPIQTQTFSNNNYRGYEEKQVDKPKKEKPNTDPQDRGKSKSDNLSESKPHNLKDTEDKQKSTNFMRFSNKKSYNRYDSGHNYNNSDRYSKNKDRFKQNNYNRNPNRDEYVQNVAEDSTKPSNVSSKYNNYPRDNSYGSKNRYKNGESSYSRNYYDYNERSSSESNTHSDKNRYSNPENAYSSDKYRNSNPDNNAHSSTKYRNSASDNNSYSSDKYRNPNPDNNASDKYRNSSSKNSYRNSYKEENKYENWRSNTPATRDRYESNNSRDNSKKNDREDRYRSRNNREKHPKEKHVENDADDVSQRDRLTEQVNRGTLECLVCCEFVRQVDKVWSCQKCYHIFHLRCSLKWAKTSKDDNGWRCPACQHVCAKLPSHYNCYCGQATDPAYRPGDTAHSCGSVCGRVGIKPGCPHKCRLLCHPGPCPVCEDLISKSCNCGATKQIVKCSADTPLICKATCGKPLNCTVHMCQKICHPKECETCTETINQECFCGNKKKTVPCTVEEIGVTRYSCNEVCDKMLLCGNHKCPNICHPGDCPPCVRAVDQVKSCPCGKSELTEKRESCLDPIPCCEKVCGKRYMCGQPSNPHTCKELCHDGDCTVCPLSSLVLCRCGHMSKEIPCSELMTRADDARCEKKCAKKRSCAKHKCNQLCCIEVDHICPLPCNRMLSCGQHRCEQTCHKGRCLPCWRTSFDELYCECGASVIYPPIMCGTKRPPCSKPCTRDHGCDHSALHTCHSQPECPPCTVLTTKWCHGKHEKRSTIPCHQLNFSCGLPCGKDLPCGRHKCVLPCHLGPCLKEGQTCVQFCTVPRETCGHNCGLPCHEPPCPEAPCKETVKVTCECGLRSSTRACIDMAGEYQRIANSMLASKMADMQLGHSVDIGDILGTTRKQILKTLECSDDCRLIERNRRLAIGLQIRNPDLSAKLTPKYSDYMRLWAKKDARFCQMIHDKLSELVQLAKQSKQKSRSYSFDSMNRDKRHFIHEYCEHFGCESAAYDQEPNRNVVATAQRDKAWLPSVSVLQLLQRENGQRKVPGPILNRPLGASKPSTSQSVSLKVSNSSTPRASFSSTVQRPKTPEAEKIDYFDYDPLKPR